MLVHLQIGHFLNESSFGILVFLSKLQLYDWWESIPVGCLSTCNLSLLYGASLPVGFLMYRSLITCLSFSLPIEGHFLMKLLSGESLSVRFLVSCSG